MYACATHAVPLLKNTYAAPLFMPLSFALPVPVLMVEVLLSSCGAPTTSVRPSPASATDAPKWSSPSRLLALK